MFAVAAGLLAVFIPTNVAEVFGYTPMLGSSAYITFLTVQTATTYMLPALFGGLFLSYINDDCGEYIAKNKSLTMIVPLALVLIVNLFYPLAGKEGFVVIGCMVLNVICAYVLYKTGIIKMSPKPPKAAGSVAKQAAKTSAK